jgi:cysteine desulfurase
VIYLDANATARLKPVARQAVEEILREDSRYRNASSVHQAGRSARALISAARKSVLDLAGCDRSLSAQLFFTGGGSEACNTLVFAFTGRTTVSSGSIVVSAIEHPAMLEACKAKAALGWDVLHVAPESSGCISPDAVVKAVRTDTFLVSVMAANNETGAIQPIREITARLRSEGYRGVVISDATQLLGKSELTIASLFAAGVDAVSISGHKIGAPAGTGAVILSKVRTDACYEFTPYIVGGAQEAGFRAGTENLIGIHAFGRVASELSKTLNEDIQRMTALREELWSLLSSRIARIERITPHDAAISNTLCVRIEGCRGDDLVVGCDVRGLCISTGSACASGKQQISHVLRAMKLTDSAARDVVRLSLDWDTTSEDIEQAARIIEEVAFAIRESAGAIAAAPQEAAWT